MLYEIPESLKELDQKNRCHHVVNSIKDFFGIDTVTGLPGQDLKNSLLGKSFIHNGYAGSDLSQDELFNHLDMITQIKVSIFSNTNTSSSQITCQSTLLGNKIQSP